MPKGDKASKRKPSSKSENGSGGTKKKKSKSKARRTIRSEAGGDLKYSNLTIKRNENVTIDTTGKGKLDIQKITMENGATLQTIGELELVVAKK